jgi:hypothetical protein
MSGAFGLFAFKISRSLASFQTGGRFANETLDECQTSYR